MEAERKVVAVVIAHPDDEVLWTGGLLIDHPLWDIFIACLCRKGDRERSERFSHAMDFLGAKWKMDDMDDNPEQRPLPTKLIQDSILRLLPHKHFDFVITHNPDGEYTRPRRHEEVANAVIKLWYSGKIQTEELWTFVYEDGNRTYFPRASAICTYNYWLSPVTWKKKYHLITEIYGFDKDSWEVLTTPKQEAFRQLEKSEAGLELLHLRRKEYNR
ncbi:PIG-L family deacetylase [Pedobacter sp. ASV1-7]|uniref:PIG-L family deacetylase n=1 Tax=Pedobacter sp. ASV1-7 TaxID=3145237 RepID=UPI0032E90F53